jgi:hypothetical protein
LLKSKRGMIPTTSWLAIRTFNHEASDCRRIAGSYSEGKQEGFQSPANRLCELLECQTLG